MALATEDPGWSPRSGAYNTRPANIAMHSAAMAQPATSSVLKPRFRILPRNPVTTVLLRPCIPCAPFALLRFLPGIAGMMKPAADPLSVKQPLHGKGMHALPCCQRDP
ncbi:MAG: hypothetical protein IOC71_00795 [Rhodobacter sp.]|nr:hypothetical protein [Rhodobacter sp.]